MRVPVQETIYVNSDIYQGEAGTSTITNVSTNTPIVYGENPSANQPILIPISTTQSGGVKPSLIDDEIQPIKTPISSTTNTSTGGTKTNLSTSNTPIASALTSATATTSTKPTTTTTKKSKYLLYGGGALVVAFIVYKLFKK